MRAVRVAFVRWYEQGLIYRGERLVNWCPTDQTGLSDSEVEHEEVDGELLTFRYPLSDGTGHVEVATTRVETMLGDTGIAVHPDDDRYRELIGKTVRHPFDGRDLPIVADEAVDPAFGTGAVKVTPAHDPTDFDIAQRTGLPLLNILDAEARINEHAAEEFYGLGRYDARQAVREELEKLGLFVGVEHPYRHSVGHCYRCHSEIEPWMSGLQWFVAVEDLKRPAIEAARDGRITFWPERWRKAYVSWMEGLRDWNISRQLWWGHRIPAWYCPDGHVTVALEDPDACATCGSAELEQDPDVLDTWFSSQLWPFSTLGWPDETPELRAFYPNAVLVTGYEILYLWVARMIMSGHVARRRHPVPRRRDPRARPRRARPEDVEVARERDRSDRDDRSPRSGRAAVLARAPGDRRPAGHPAVGRFDQGRAELREQDLERRPARPAGVPRRRAGAPARGAAHGAAAVAPRAAPALRRRGERGARRVRVRARGPGAVPILLVRVLRLGPRDGEGPAAVRGRGRADRHGRTSSRGSSSERSGCCTR